MYVKDEKSYTAGIEPYSKTCKPYDWHLPMAAMNLSLTHVLR